MTKVEFLKFRDTPPNPKSKNQNPDYRTMITRRKAAKTSEDII
jgi:hypothetical protein